VSPVLDSAHRVLSEPAPGRSLPGREPSRAAAQGRLRMRGSAEERLAGGPEPHVHPPLPPPRGPGAHERDIQTARRQAGKRHLCAARVAHDGAPRERQGQRRSWRRRRPAADEGNHSPADAEPQRPTVRLTAAIQELTLLHAKYAGMCATEFGGNGQFLGALKAAFKAILQTPIAVGARGATFIMCLMQE
jgi:hypothetical protein